MKKDKRNMGNKTQDLHFRVTRKDKEKLSKEAKRLGLSVSEYIRSLIMGKKSSMEPSSKEIKAIVICQDIVTYVQEKYCCEDDEELKERIKALWRVL